MVLRKLITATRGAQGCWRLRTWRASAVILLVSCVVINSLGVVQTYAQGEIPEDLVITIGQFDASNYPEITFYVNVTDTSGAHVSDMTQDDFAVTEDGAAVEITGFAGIGEVRLVDIVYVFDTTASMADEISGVIRTSKAFADKLESKGRDYRLGLVTFADQVLQLHREDDTLTQDAEEFKGWVSELVAEGGDSDPENDYAAIKRAAQMNFRPDSQKIFILITDALPHHYGDPPDGGQVFDDPDLEYQAILDYLNEGSISLYAVTPDIYEFSSLASETGGKLYDIKNNPDFTGIIEDIGETIANQYRITYLSPRPTYDGTRRDVKVKIGKTDVATAYAEAHLLNIQSDLLVGIFCVFPLIAALMMPLAVQALLQRIKRRQRVDLPEPPPTKTAVEQSEVRGVGLPVPEPGDETPTVVPVVLGEEGSSCINCGTVLRSEARFCPECGRPIAAAISPAEVPTPSQAHSYCPNCGNVLRPGARFCPVCGIKI